jgi:beta-lactamase class D
MEQAKLLCRLNAGKLSFSKQSIKFLKDIMMIKTTATGVLYGKTGSGADETGMYTLGWFVGFVESNGKTYSFACAIKGENVMGKDARAIVELILEKQGLL